jgi:hypothetical protein
VCYLESGSKKAPEWEVWCVVTLSAEMEFSLQLSHSTLLKSSVYKWPIVLVSFEFYNPPRRQWQAMLRSGGQGGGNWKKAGSEDGEQEDW